MISEILSVEQTKIVCILGN